MKPQHAYLRQSVTQCTRIDLLLKLLDVTIQAIRQGADALARADQKAVSTARSRSLRGVLMLIEGLDESGGTLVENLRRLEVFVVNCVASDEPRSWRVGADVLSTLRDGYAGIRDEAVRLETSGQIPRGDSRELRGQLV